MSRIVHVALKCGSRESLDRASKMYEEAFGIYPTKSGHKRGHLSWHMTEGKIDLALMVYDSEDEKEAKLAGAGPRIHHIGIEVEDRPSMIKKIEDNGGSIFSDRKEGALKYRSADGTLGEIVAAGRYPKKGDSKLGQITNVTYHVTDVAKAVRFYKNVFGFSELPGATAESCTLTDGDTTLSFRKGGTPEIYCWSVGVPDTKAATEKVKQLGGKIVDAPASGGIRFIGPDGNMAEVVSYSG